MKTSLPAFAMVALAIALGSPVRAAQQAPPVPAGAAAPAQGAQAVPTPGVTGASRADAAVKPGEPACAQLPKAAPEPVEKVGFGRLSQQWPAWLVVTLADRVRAESIRPAGVRAAGYDTYLLNRFRLTAAMRFSNWAQATVQAQDARVVGYDAALVPKSIANPFDLRLAYVQFGKKAARGLVATIGRQELIYGDGRLMSSPDWGNVGRTYDGIRLVAFAPGVRVDVFGAGPVDVTPAAFSEVKYGERVAGAWTTFDRVRPLAYVEVYALAKHNNAAVGETLSRGDQTVYTTGARLGGPVGRRLMWEADNAVQRGHSAGDAISAWASHEGLTWALGAAPWKPTLGVEYNFASGDSDPHDGTKGTFDQLYASTHGKWGLADQVAWKNMHHAAVRLELRPSRKLRVNSALNKLALATVNDAWYGVLGSKVVTNRKATSRDLGWEPDVFAAYSVSRDVTVGAGVAVLLGGGFVRQSTGVDRIWTPYVQWTCTF
jgi:Alginate export